MPMWYSNYIFILTFTEVVSENIINPWLNTFEKQMLNNIKSSQLIIFSNNSLQTKSQYQDITIAMLIKIIPCINIDTMKLMTSDDHLYLEVPLFKNPRQTSTFVMTYYAEQLYEAFQILNFKNYIDFIDTVFSFYQRPKCLILFINNKQSTEDFLKIILRYAWSKKFLDFTIMELDTQYAEKTDVFSPNLYYLNPFLDTLTKVVVDSNIEIFPDKLNNLNGYPLIFPVMSLPPIIELIKDSKGNIIKTKTDKFGIVEITAAKLDFYMKFISAESNITFYEDMKIVNKLLQNRKADMGSALAPSLNIPAIGELDFGHGCTSFVAIIPIIKENYINIPTDIYMYLFIIPSMLVITLYVMNILKIQKTRWSVLDILQVLFGFSIPTKKFPRKSSERIIFLSIIAVSMQYTLKFYSKILDINLESSEISFNSIEEIIGSPFDVHMSAIYYKRVFDTDVESIVTLKQKLKTVPDTGSCVKMILAGNKTICIIPENYAEYYVMKNKGLMTIAKPEFFCERLIYMTANAFPYYEKFSKIFHKIHSSGLLQASIHTYRKTVYNEQSKNSANDVTDVIIAICSIYLISLIVFLLEIIIKKYCKN